MKKSLILALILLVITLPVEAQLRSNYAQYMLNQGIINPGFADIESRYGGIVSVRKQWLTMGDTPLSVFANGHYRFTKNHTIGGNITSDQINNLNTLDISANYVFHAWLTRKLALGMGIKLGYQQVSLKNDFVYFDGGTTDPVLTNLKAGGLNLGAGLSLQSQNFLFGFSVPFLFNNAAANKKFLYSTTDNHFYTTLGYKFRFSDGFILYPSAMVKGVPGAPLSMSFDGHVLVNQMFWFGGGYRSDNTVAISGGVFLEKGLRLVYTYESAYFSPHKRMDSSHEVTLNYARSIYDSPFSKRLYRKRSGKLRKNPNPLRR